LKNEGHVSAVWAEATAAATVPIPRKQWGDGSLCPVHYRKAKMLIALTGPLGCGKSTIANYLREKEDYRIVSFAAPLKEIAKRITPDGKIVKTRDRALLQFLGTDYFRAIDPDYWVNRFVEDATLGFGDTTNVVNDDCRFPNEKLAIKRLGGFLVYVVADKEQCAARQEKRDGKRVEGISGHASEHVGTQFDDDIDYVFDNTRPAVYISENINLMLDSLKK
jgi:hypothetical protein